MARLGFHESHILDPKFYQSGPHTPQWWVTDPEGTGTTAEDYTGYDWNPGYVNPREGTWGAEAYGQMGQAVAEANRLYDFLQYIQQGIPPPSGDPKHMAYDAQGRAISGGFPDTFRKWAEDELGITSLGAKHQYSDEQLRQAMLRRVSSGIAMELAMITSAQWGPVADYAKTQGWGGVTQDEMDEAISHLQFDWKPFAAEAEQILNNPTPTKAHSKYTPTQHRALFHVGPSYAQHPPGSGKPIHPPGTPPPDDGGTPPPDDGGTPPPDDGGTPPPDQSGWSDAYKAIYEFSLKKAELDRQLRDGEIDKSTYDAEIYKAYVETGALNASFTTVGDPGLREYQPNWIELPDGAGYALGGVPGDIFRYFDNRADPAFAEFMGVKGKWAGMAEGGWRSERFKREAAQLNQQIADMQYAISRGMDEYGRPLSGDTLAAYQQKLAKLQSDLAIKIQEIQTGGWTPQMAAAYATNPSAARDAYYKEKGLTLGSYTGPGEATGHQFTQGSRAAALMARFRPDAFGQQQRENLSLVPTFGQQLYTPPADQGGGDQQPPPEEKSAPQGQQQAPPPAPESQAQPKLGGGQQKQSLTANAFRRATRDFRNAAIQGNFNWFGKNNPMFADSMGGIGRKAARDARQKFIDQYGQKAFKQVADSERARMRDMGYNPPPLTPEQQAKREAALARQRARNQQG